MNKPSIIKYALVFKQNDSIEQYNIDLSRFYLSKTDAKIALSELETIKPDQLSSTIAKVTLNDETEKPAISAIEIELSPKRKIK